MFHIINNHTKQFMVFFWLAWYNQLLKNICIFFRASRAKQGRQVNEDHPGSLVWSDRQDQQGKEKMDFL